MVIYTITSLAHMDETCELSLNQDIAINHVSAIRIARGYIKEAIDVLELENTDEWSDAYNPFYSKLYQEGVGTFVIEITQHDLQETDLKKFTVLADESASGMTSILDVESSGKDEDGNIDWDEVEYKEVNSHVVLEMHLEAPTLEDALKSASETYNMPTEFLIAYEEK